MKNIIIKKKLYFTIGLIILIFFGYIYYINSNIEVQERKCAYRIQRILIKKIKELDYIVKEINKTGNISSFKELDKKGLILLIYRGDSLLSWSNNSIYVPLKYDSIFFNKRISFNSNGWFFLKNYAFDDFKVVGIIRIKNEFLYENKYLKNRIHDDFRIKQDVILSEKPDKYNIYDNDGNFLFSIHIKNLVNKSILSYLLLIIYIFLILILFFVIAKLIIIQKSNVIRYLILVFLISIVIILRILQILTKFPALLYDSQLFNPVYFASSDLLPSLGDCLINSIIILCIFVLLLYFNRKYINKKTIVVLFENLLFTFYFFFLIYQIKVLVLNSSISFEFHKLGNLNFLTIIAFFIISIHLFVLMYILNYRFKTQDNLLSEKSILTIILFALMIFLSFNLTGYKIDLIFGLFFIAFYIFFSVLRKIFTPESYTFLVFQLLLLSLLTIYTILYYNNKKEKQNMQIIAENLSYEHDPVAEYLFEEVSSKIQNDSILKNYLFNLNITYDEIYKYLRDNYFSGYWIKYNLLFYDCRPYDSVIFKIPETYKAHCYNYFSILIEKYGMLLPNSNFYYMKNKSGRINYLGVFTFYDKKKNVEMSIFIELETRQNIDLPGYPAILLDENIKRNVYSQDYSYAKYKNGILISKYGDFSYSYHENYFNVLENKNIYFFRNNGFLHLVYKSKNDVTIVISKPILNVFDVILSFSYVFIFFYVLFLVIYAFHKLKEYKVIILTIKNKIQISLILILLISLVFTGLGIVFFSIKQQEKKNFEYLKEKIQSIYAELDSRFAFKTNIKVDDIFFNKNNNKEIDQFIYKLSDIFYTDINLYSIDGVLITTSRPEIFNRKLVGNLMNPEAYYEIIWNGKTEFIHYENIGKLKYLSAYIPYINARGKFLGFINLPYFIKEDIVKKEIINLLVTISNVYVILILLALVLSMVLSNTITRNLKMLKDRFSKIELLKKHELIEYKGNDEIAGLVNEYNRMVAELQKNAELLAKTEREMAWREMARQVAHEIKNPLTPMKLNVQYLYKAWKEKREDFDDVLKKVTEILIEQIDNLSRIASEFSNFAKMPQPINEKVNLEDILQKVMDLYSNQNVEIIKKIETELPIYLFVDKDQILRAFINLINNGIQSVPDDKYPRIEITIKRFEDKIKIEISDNGKGIPDDLKDKLFIPNFTTKSSGMGLGLAITKNIIESAGGSISFVSGINKGTTFIIILPEMKF